MNKAKLSWPVLLVLVVVGWWLKSGDGDSDAKTSTKDSSAASTQRADRSPSNSDRSERGGESRETGASGRGPSESPEQKVSTSKEDPARNAAAVAKIEDLYRRKKSKVMVEVWGEVVKILPDDDIGSRHQKFLFEVSRRRTLKVAHNIDLAPRVPVKEGDRVLIRGQYEFDQRGGVLHWTHDDPRNRREGGWIEHRGRRYE